MDQIQVTSMMRVSLREAWIDEARQFTPWLAENIHLLGETIGTQLEVQAQEKPIGMFRADIVALDTLTNETVLIENQLERTDHSHLGQLLTYASGLQAGIMVWVAGQFCDEHRAALDWLNQIQLRFLARPQEHENGTIKKKGILLNDQLEE